MDPIQTRGDSEEGPCDCRRYLAGSFPSGSGLVVRAQEPSIRALKLERRPGRCRRMDRRYRTRHPAIDLVQLRHGVIAGTPDRERRAVRRRDPDPGADRAHDCGEQNRFRINPNDVRHIVREHFDEPARKADTESLDIVLPRRCNPGETGSVSNPHFSRVVCYSAGSIRQCCVPLRRAPRRTVKYASGALRARALL